MNPLLDGVKISAPFSPTRYDVPAITEPPAARPPPNTLSMTLPMPLTNGFDATIEINDLIAPTAELIILTRFANSPMTTPMAFPITVKATPSTSPMAGASVVIINFPIFFISVKNGSSFSLFFCTASAMYPNAFWSPPRIGVNVSTIPGIKISEMNDHHV